MQGIFYTDEQNAEGGLVRQRGFLAIDNVAAVTTASCFGRGITWSRQSAGVYRGAIDQTMRGLSPAGSYGAQVHATLVKPTACKFGVEVINQDITANGYFELRITDSTSSLAAVDPDTALGVNVEIIHKNASVP